MSRVLGAASFTRINELTGLAFLDLLAKWLFSPMADPAK
jgi:hypothetical protein